MSIATDDRLLGAQLAELRHESGWREVESGLARILLGHFIILGGPLLGVGMLGLFFASSEASKPGKGMDLIFTAVLTGGGLLLGLVISTGYAVMVRGFWSCIMGASERHGAKWLMFASLTCLIMGPALNLVCFFAGVDRYPRVEKGLEGLRQMQVSASTLTLELACSLFSVAGSVLFLLFLHATARCFRDERRARNVLLYLFCAGLLLAGTTAVLLTSPQSLLAPETLMGLAVLWIGNLFWYLGVIGSIRSCIQEGMALTDAVLRT